MLDEYGLKFAKAIVALSDAKILCFPAPLQPGEQPVADRQVSFAVAYGLDLMREACVAAGMGNVTPELDRIALLISPRFAAQRLPIVQAITHLLSRVQDDLASQKFFRVPNDDVQFYGNDKLFGELVATKFKPTVEDIKNAGNCLALGQATACVFHLMRAMEAAVRQLGRRLRVTITPQTTWRQMTGQMDDKIKKMPEATEAQKRKKNKWEEARANLHHVGSVWRNNTMHPATTYTPSQARDVLNAVRVFMNGLCNL
jgi:hypothetical protein